MVQQKGIKGCEDTLNANAWAVSGVELIEESL